jgi:hypothetical protein
VPFHRSVRLALAVVQMHFKHSVARGGLPRSAVKQDCAAVAVGATAHVDPPPEHYVYITRETSVAVIFIDCRGAV